MSISKWERKACRSTPSAAKPYRAGNVLPLWIAAARGGYSPGTDEIVVPKIERFPEVGSYYSILAHELTH